MGSIEKIFEEKELPKEQIKLKLRTFAAPVLDKERE